MRWVKAELFGKVKVGEDRLKNPIFEDKKICDIKVRATPWNISEITQLGQSFTTSNRKFITPSRVILFRGYWEWNTFSFVDGEIVSQYERCSVVVNGDKYNVESIKSLGGKFTGLTVKAVKL